MTRGVSNAAPARGVAVAAADAAGGAHDVVEFALEIKVPVAGPASEPPTTQPLSSAAGPRLTRKLVLYPCVGCVKLRLPKRRSPGVTGASFQSSRHPSRPGTVVR